MLVCKLIQVFNPAMYPIKHNKIRKTFIVQIVLACGDLAPQICSADAAGIQVEPPTGKAIVDFNKLCDSGSGIKLVPKLNGKWDIRPTGSTSTASSLEISPLNSTLKDISKSKEFGESWVEFRPKKEGQKHLLIPEVASRWAINSFSNEKSVRGKEVDELVRTYSDTVSKMATSNDPGIYKPPSISGNSEFASATKVLRSKLIQLASEPDLPESAAAAKTLVESASTLELQGAALGMQRVSLQATNALYRAASGVGVVLQDGNRAGVCTRTSHNMCATAAHVAKAFTSQPSRLSIQFHIEGVDKKMQALTVPVRAVQYRDKYFPKTLRKSKGGGVSEDILPSVDYAFLEMDLGSNSLTDENRETLKRAEIVKVYRNDLTTNAINQSRQFFHISYDPNQNTLNGPQIQFRCALICPPVTFSTSDIDEIFNGLFARCLLSKAQSLLNATGANMPKLCGTPIKTDFINAILLPEKGQVDKCYCTPFIEGLPSCAICYEATTFKGDSGAPLFLYDDTLQEVVQVAVHMAADNSTVATTFTSNRSAYAAPVSLFHPDDLKNFCIQP